MRTDRVTKFAEYAEYADAGIPGYWLVDLNEPLSVTAYTLVDAVYELSARSTGRLDLESPVALSLDLAGLLRRRQ